jgi:hypothetical protein
MTKTVNGCVMIVMSSRYDFPRHVMDQLPSGTGSDEKQQTSLN